MLTRINDFDFDDSPCFLAVKNSWHLTRVPLPCGIIQVQKDAAIKKNKEKNFVAFFARHFKPSIKNSEKRKSDEPDLKEEKLDETYDDHNIQSTEYEEVNNPNLSSNQKEKSAKLDDDRKNGKTIATLKFPNAKKRRALKEKVAQYYSDKTFHPTFENLHDTNITDPVISVQQHFNIHNSHNDNKQQRDQIDTKAFFSKRKDNEQIGHDFKSSQHNSKDRIHRFEIGSISLTKTQMIKQWTLDEIQMIEEPLLQVLCVVMALITIVHVSIRKHWSRSRKANSSSDLQSLQRYKKLSESNDIEKEQTIDTIIVMAALADDKSKNDEKAKLQDLRLRIEKECSSVLPIQGKTHHSKQKCILLIQKLTRLTIMGKDTEYLLGLIEDWTNIQLEINIKNEETEDSSTSTLTRRKLHSMIGDLYQFLQAKYELPSSAVITLLPFVITNACVDDICCAKRLGNIIHAAETRLGGGDRYRQSLQNVQNKRCESTATDKTQRSNTKTMAISQFPPKTIDIMKNRLPQKPSSDLNEVDQTGPSINNIVAKNTRQFNENRKVSTDYGQKLAYQEDLSSAIEKTTTPMLLSSIDTTNRESAGMMYQSLDAACDVDECLYLPAASSMSISRLTIKNENKLPLHRSSQHRSPRSKDSFIYRMRYLEAVKKLKHSKRNRLDQSR